MVRQNIPPPHHIPSLECCVDELFNSVDFENTVQYLAKHASRLAITPSGRNLEHHPIARFQGLTSAVYTHWNTFDVASSLFPRSLPLLVPPGLTSVVVESPI